MSVRGTVLTAAAGAGAGAAGGGAGAAAGTAAAAAAEEAVAVSEALLVRAGDGAAMEASFGGFVICERGIQIGREIRREIQKFVKDLVARVFLSKINK